jgi:hypothetical protein
MITRKNLGMLGIEVTCEPDEEYEYLHCKDTEDNSNFFLRLLDDTINIFEVNNGCWNLTDFKFSKMPREDLVITTITRKVSVLLPTRNQAYQQLNVGSN